MLSITTSTNSSINVIVYHVVYHIVYHVIVIVMWSCHQVVHHQKVMSTCTNLLNTDISTAVFELSRAGRYEVQPKNVLLLGVVTKSHGGETLPTQKLIF